MDDAKIVQLYWDRNEQAIPVTADKYGNYCTSIAKNILGNHADAEECVNDTYMSAWNSMPPHRPGIAMAACLCLVVVGAFIVPNLGDGALDYVETVVYDNVEYAVCGTGEASILEECGLPTEITKDLAGKHLGYLEQTEKNTFVVADDLENSKVELFEYAPQPNNNVYILCIEGEYYAAIRRDSEGYHGISEFDKGV